MKIQIECVLLREWSKSKISTGISFEGGSDKDENLEILEKIVHTKFEGWVITKLVFV